MTVEAITVATETVTLRVQSSTLARIDSLAQRSGASRTQVVLDAVEAALTRDADARRAALEETRAWLRAPIEAQDAFLDEVSVADEWRPF